MAIEILDKGATRVMGSTAERGDSVDDEFLALGLLDIDVSSLPIFEYDAKLAVEDFIGMWSGMYFPDGSGGRNRALYPNDDSGFTIDGDSPGYGYCYAVFKVRKSPVTVDPFVP